VPSNTSCPRPGPGARVPFLKEAILWIGATQDYEYTGDTYRTICMTKSNFGGMENVGNTTIVTDAALIHEHTLDQSLIYAHAVIVHEFEHNQCGSETTMETPFDVWLNEAYTVDVERQFTASVFDPAFVRLNQVDAIRNPLLGPLAIEDSGAAGRIVREGFNNPDELIDGVTYVKAAEVIRMLRLILGNAIFTAGKALYFSRYRHSNANTDQFFSMLRKRCRAGRSNSQKRMALSNRALKVTAARNTIPQRKR
jgi:aminopeptidase N